jgi:Na+/H+ antiporter NhaD/arsenite permease-like protein
MVAAAVLSWKTTPKPVHEANDFSFGPVKEVAWLFIGIFLTMRPALDILQSGKALALTSPAHFYFSSGALSAFLDNAPTYLAFLTAAMGLHHQSVDDPAQVLAFANEHSLFVIAVSLGSVFFGAGSYIGNGPNLMVKSICDHSKVHTPHFFRYIWRYSLPMLIPVLIVVSWFLFH